MKVLLLSPLPPPVGGIASWTVNILEYYKQHDTEIELLHFNTALKSRDITNHNIVARLKSGMKDTLVMFPPLLKYLRKHKPDVIHVTSSGSIGLVRDLLILNTAKILQIPTVIHFRFGRIPDLSHTKNWEWKLLNNVICLSSSTIVLDIASEQVLTKMGYSNIYRIPNPISKDIEGMITTHTTHHNFIESSKVLFVGHITKNKGIFELIEACINLDEIINELILVGPYEEDTRNKIVNRSIKSKLKLNITGSLDKEAVLKKMQGASVLVLPSYSEGFPNVVIEAMAMGCPVIASNVGAIPEMLDINTNNPAGIVVRPKDTQALSEAIRNILINDDLAITYSNNALDKVISSYTLHKVCNAYESIWKSINYN